MEPFLVGARVPPGKGAIFLEGPKHDEGPKHTNDVGPTSLADVGPTARRQNATSGRRRAASARRRPAAGPMSKRRRADVNYRYVADEVLTSARRCRVYWVGP